MDAKKLNNQEKLDHIFEMVNELNEEMHHLKRMEAASSAFRLFYMVIIVAALGGAYYFLSPFFDTIKKAPQLIDTTMQNIDELKKKVPDSTAVEGAINILKNNESSQNALKNIDPATLQAAEKLIRDAQSKGSSTSH